MTFIDFPIASGSILITADENVSNINMASERFVWRLKSIRSGAPSFAGVF